MMRIPARSLIRFMANHPLLSATGQPQWCTVSGDAHEYVERLTRFLAEKIHIGCGADNVTRGQAGVTVLDTTGRRERFGHVAFASHDDETLRLFADAGTQERDVLGAFRHQKNVAVLHRDTSAMPKCRRYWASWT